jgi:hypothetical protein
MSDYCRECEQHEKYIDKLEKQIDECPQCVFNDLHIEKLKIMLGEGMAEIHRLKEVIKTLQGE